MSFLSSLFEGWGAKNPTTAARGGPTKDATTVIDQNFEHQETLEDKAGKAEHEAAKCIAKYVEMQKKGDTRGAAIQKQRAVMYKKQAATLRLQANNLIQQGIVLEEAASNAAVHETMQDSLRTGQGLLTHIDVDAVAETADDWQELYAESREVGRAMSSPLSLGGISDGEEEDALDAEIAQLMDAQSLHAAEEIALPNAPQHVPIKGGGGGAGGGGGGSAVKVTPKSSKLFQ